MDDYLTTDQLLILLKKSAEIVDESKPKKIFKLNKKFIYVSIAVLAVLHLVFMAMPLIFKDKTTQIIGYQYVVAIYQDQPIDDELIGKTFRMENVDFEDITAGSKVLVYGLYGSQVFWEVEVTSVDDEQQIVSATFDGIISNNYQMSEIRGLAIRDANVIGIAYYTASTPMGFLYIFLFHIIILAVLYYFMFVFKLKK